MSNIAKCPSCQKSDHIDFSISSGGGRGELSAWQGKCECGFSINYLGDSGTKAGAKSEWNYTLAQYYLYPLVEGGKIFAFDCGENHFKMLDKTGFTERQLKTSLNKMAKNYYLDKMEQTAYDIDGLNNGSKYGIFTLTKDGEDLMHRLYRTIEREIK